MDEDYEVGRRRQAEERRRKKAEERQKRKAKLGLSTSRQKPSGVLSVGSDPKTDKTGSPGAEKSRKRIRVEKLKEEKREKDGIRLIQKMYGTTYLKSDDLFKDDSPVEQRSAKQSAKTVRCEISPSSGGVIISDDLKADMKSASRSSVESRHYNEQNLKAKSTQGWQTSSSVSTQKKTALPAKLRPSWNNNEYSSSDEDLVALAQKLEQKKKLSPSQRMNASLKSKTAAKEKGGDDDLANSSPDQRRINNSASSDEDLTKTSEKDNAENRKDAYCYDSNGEQDSSPNSERGRGRKATKKQRSDSESDAEDLFAYSRKFQRLHKKKRRDDGSDVSSSEDEISVSIDDRKFKGEEKTFVVDVAQRKLSPPKRRNMQNDYLWDDSEEETPINSSGKDEKKEKVDSSKRRGRKLGAGHHRSFESPESDIDEFEDDSTLEKQMKPFFEDPKWEFECKPFVMSRSAVYAGEDHEVPNQDGEGETDEIPAAINRYLKDFQKEGVQFLHSVITRGLGAVLGDDMGLGKTVQIISLIAALQKKTGSKKDLKVIKERYQVIGEVLDKQRADEDFALLQGGTVHRDVLTQVRPYSPILIVVPPSVLTNWENEFKSWGHFAVASYRDSNRAQALHRIKIGMEDILLCGKSMLSQKKFFPPLLEVEWKLIIIDEFHEYKNPKSASYKGLLALRNSSVCPLIGMTGTLMSNAHKELFTLIDLVQPGLLGEWKEFAREYSRPLMLARTKDAKSDVLKLGEHRSDELQEVLSNVYLRREKSVCLEDDLPTKNQKVVFCGLSDIQKRLYQHIINEVPEYELLRKSASPCDCGVNKNFFMNYMRLPTKAQQLDYHRRHRENIVPRKRCCYQIPKGDRLVLWPSQHPDGEPCKNCPTCILLPALNKLYKLCSHPVLLQAERHPDTVNGEKAKEKAEKELAFAKVAIPDDVLRQLPGKSYVRESSIMTDHSRLSGKMKTLEKCLKKFAERQDRVLLFSYSTITLDLIQQFITERGYSHLRLDGSTPTSKRQMLIDTYQQKNDIFIFLISTKAGGMGLNLTAANRVIIYDVNWNPSHDEQAQDRSYRIGQERDVDVIRLVAEGTIEELMYLRQIYKVHLKQQTLKSDDYTPARIFRGVDKDKNRKGELFGLENLLKFKDGSFMEALWKATAAIPKKSTTDTYSAGDLADALQGVSTDLIENGLEDEEPDFSNVIESGFDNEDVQGFNHEDFLREDRGDAAVREGDEGYDEEMGAESQLVDQACEEIDGLDKESTEQIAPENSEDAEKELLANLKSTVGLTSPIEIAAIKQKFATMKTALEKKKETQDLYDSSDRSKHNPSSDPSKKVEDSVSVKPPDAQSLPPPPPTLAKQPAGSVSKNYNVLKSAPAASDIFVKKTTETAAQLKPKENAKKKASSFFSKKMLYIPSYLRDKT